ncbi:MAG TPA: PAS domain S-box protein, partial [Anaerolineales bacterium]|nr:PAS domain S-box protein [Anaerolineales bacterium]
MNTLSIPMVAMAGISLYVGFYHLLIYFRHRQSRADLMFALLCFAYVFYAIFCAGLYNATSVAEGAEWQRVQLIALAVFVTAFLWFVADYTHQKPGAPIYLFSIFYLVAIIVQSVDRSELTFWVDQPSIKYVTLPHIQPITYYEATFGPFTIVQSMMGVVASTYILIMGVRYFKRGYRREAVPLILAIMLMYIAGLHDTLVSNGVYHFIYLIEYAYLAVILLMANSLSTTVVEAAIAKEELRRSEERLRALVETTSDWVWEVDVNGVYTYASPKIRDLLGYEPEEVIGRTPFDIMPEEEAERVRAVFQSTVLERKPFENLENIARCKDGQLAILETNGVPFFDDYGRLLGYRGIDRNITERKRAEQALQAKTEELDRYFTSSLDLLCIADTNGYFRRLNPAWETTLGYAIAELEGRQFLEFVHPEDIEATRATVSRLADQEQILNFENRYRCKDGSYRWIEWRSFPIEKMIYAVARDITERKQVEEALRESEQELRASEEKYRTLVEVSPIGIWISKNQVIAYANPAAVKIFGATDLSEIVGKTSFDFIHPDYHPVVRERITQMMEARKVVPLLEEKYVRLDGKVVDVEVIATPIITSEGTIIQVFFQDITKRKQAEQALRESEERLRQITSSLRETIWLRDVQTRQVLYVNPAFEQLTGWSCESFYENPDIVINAIHPDDKEWVIQALAQRFEGVPYNKEHRIIHRDGSVRWVSSRSFPVRNEAGEVYRWASIMEDITERKQAETERERLI